jgi:glycosyltransferase involved in cell wall biosynthesis
MAKLYIIVNEDRFFLSHRKDIALEAQKAGFDVTVVCKDTGRIGEVTALGLKVTELPINPTGTNLKEEWKTYRFLKKLYKEERPDIVHHVGLKNILWGGLAAKRAMVHGVVNAVSGLGVLFSDKKPSLMTLAIMAVIKYANHRDNLSVIFQNHEDQNLFLRHHIVKANQCDFIKGSGVDLEQFAYTPDPGGDVIRVIFTARMVKEKGILVLIQAAEELRQELCDKLEFLLCGDLSANPKAISREELERLCDGKYIQWLGFRSDVHDLLAKSHIMAFPSYYREGVPKSLIEACAIGRPIVTTSWYGCKDTVDDGENGFLIPVKDSHTLAERIAQLAKDPVLRQAMGKKGRKKAEKEFSLQNVIDKHLAIYRRLTENIQPSSKKV